MGMHSPCFKLLLLSSDLHDEPFMFVRGMCEEEMHAKGRIVYPKGVQRVTVGSIAKSGNGGVKC
jgi:hypothetical protein